MSPARLLAVAALLLVLAPSAEARTSAAKVPTGLHGFLLRADEPVVHSFPRTPSFAWNPVRGAVRYQFQLSTSSAPRENGIVYTATGLTTPVVAPSTTLPWTSDNLYARVRAIFRKGASGWSAPFTFDMTPPAAPSPEPLPSGASGLLRWTPVEGADAYEVWLLDVPKREVVYTNVLDEREFYTFHHDSSWIGAIHWRVRALRVDNDPKNRANGLPAVGYGPWSAVYTSSNSAFTSGSAIRLVGTISDAFSDGSSGSAAHRLMPGFLFSGDKTSDGTTADLFRIYVSTDRACLNTVYVSAIVGGPAYAPRPFGPLPLPATVTDVASAAGSYIATDGPEPPGFMFDGTPVTTTESMAAATPTTSVPTDSDTDPTGSDNTPTTAPQQIYLEGNLGAPVDLWDTDWPTGGYYWTVVGVEALSPDTLSTTVAVPGSAVAATTIPVSAASQFAAGDTITIGTAGNTETATVTATTATTLTVAAPLQFAHGAGEAVVRTGGSLQYHDLELPQDVCAAGRVMRFGKDSEPSLTSSGNLFASGLSAGGRLTSARSTPKFYGNPLVAWTPAYGAYAYEVQWSKTRYPFTPQPDPQNGKALGRLTTGTSAVLPLSPGTWYYRVRGFNFSLRTGSQQMSWSDPAKIVIARPRFKIVGGSK
jgi:hypothetical protein